MNTLSFYWYYIFQALVLLLIANGAPILINKILGNYLAWPIDNGFKLRDHRRLFGNTKTWRGLFFAVFFTIGGALFLGLDALTGFLFGVFTIAGDLLASFLKRRRGNIESAQARGLDTVPESLLPIWLLSDPLNLGLIEIALVVVFFFLIEEFVSPILYKLHIRKRPY